MKLAALVVKGGHLAVVGLGVGWLLCLLEGVGLDSFYLLCLRPVHAKSVSRATGALNTLELKLRTSKQ